MNWNENWNLKWNLMVEKTINFFSTFCYFTFFAVSFLPEEKKKNTLNHFFIVFHMLWKSVSVMFSTTETAMNQKISSTFIYKLVFSNQSKNMIINLCFAGVYSTESLCFYFI